jgi:hypothetical protein
LLSGTFASRIFSTLNQKLQTSLPARPAWTFPRLKPNRLMIS